MRGFVEQESCVEQGRSEKFDVGFGFIQEVVLVKAFFDGWIIYYADYSTDSQNVVDTVDNNFERAMAVLKTHFKNINQI